MNIEKEALPWAGIELEIDLEDIHKEGRKVTYALDDTQNKEICKQLDLIDISLSKCELFLTPKSQDKVNLTGNIQAEITQQCSVTLEPLKSKINEDIQVEFWPEHLMSDEKPDNFLGEIEISDLDKEEPEKIQDGKINLGQYIFEVISTSIDPYPRKTGVELNWQDKEPGLNGDMTRADNPFAALEVLKKRQTDNED